MAQWTQTEIKELTKYYTLGLPLRLIANRLGRTYSALSKALVRFNILVHSTRKGTKKAKVHKTITVEELWVDFAEVLTYLANLGVQVCSMPGRFFEKEPLYAIHTKLMVPSQVLLYANRIRTDAKQLPFKVSNLSWI